MDIRAKRYLALLKCTSAIGAIIGGGTGFALGAHQGYNERTYNSGVTDRIFSMMAASVLGTALGGAAGGVAGLLWPVAIPAFAIRYVWAGKNVFLP